MAKKYIPLIISIVIFLSSCAVSGPARISSGDQEIFSPASLAAQNRAGHWITRPDFDSLTVIGVSNRQTKREDEIAGAKNEAARKIALFYGVKGKITHVNDVGSGFLEFFADSDVTLDHDTEYEKYMDALIYDPQHDVLVADGAVFVRFRYAASFPGNLDYAYGKDPDGAPEWTRRPPGRIGDYMAGVGFARPQRRFRDTTIKSYENAAATIISRLSTQVISSDSDSSLGGSSSAQYHLSEGELVNFYVLETWMDPSSKAVWTLAIAKQK